MAQKESDTVNLTHGTPSGRHTYEVHVPVELVDGLIEESVQAMALALATVVNETVTIEWNNGGGIDFVTP
jgi:hypothetical protein